MASWGEGERGARERFLVVTAFALTRTVITVSGADRHVKPQAGTS